MRIPQARLCFCDVCQTQTNKKNGSKFDHDELKFLVKNRNARFFLGKKSLTYVREVVFLIVVPRMIVRLEFTTNFI